VAHRARRQLRAGAVMRARAATPLLACVLAMSAGAWAQISPAPGLLQHLSSNRWAVNGACGNPSQIYRLEHQGATVTWYSQTGADVEEVRNDTAFEASTVTMRSNGTPVGTTWRYQLQPDGRVMVEKAGRPAFFITRCPG